MGFRAGTRQDRLHPPPPHPWKIRINLLFDDYSGPHLMAGLVRIERQVAFIIAFRVRGTISTG
jgi:hypothetical protein